MEYLFDYLLFAAKLLTVITVLSAPVLIALALRSARQNDDEPPLRIRRLNDRMKDTELSLQAAMLPGKAFKKLAKAARAEGKARAEDATRPRSFVCRFEGDVRASAVAQLREQITAILTVARGDDEVVVVLESGGGTIHGYGLAASQLRRLRERGVRLRVVVDRIAASGGYMMACVADEIIAAPFAIIGSIGVIAQLPNFHRLMQKHDIDFEQVTAGEFKRTLTVFGENTDAARAKFQQELEDAHTLFKAFVAEYRPQLDLAQVATGEYWFATRALELGLVDRLATSDDVIVAAAAAGDVLELSIERKRSLLERVLRPFSAALEQVRGGPAL